MYGERSGTATAHATFSTPRTPDDVLLRCASGGVDVTPLDFAIATDSPLVSERRARRPAYRGPKGG
jgi:hypothetical protein